MRPNGYAGYADGYAAKPCGYVSYAVTPVAPLHVCACAYVREGVNAYRMGSTFARNRVTHVTTRVSRVTDA